MTKKIIFALLTLFMLSLIVGCSNEDQDLSEEDSSNSNQSEQDYTTYEDDYITFQHRAEWLVSGSSSASSNLVTIEQGAGFDFVLEAERINDLDSEEDLATQVSEEFSQGLEAAEKKDYITQISFEDMTIDGYEGKTLQLELELLQGTAEVLYGVLSEDLAHYDEIQNYLSDYDDPKSFTEAITNNDEFQEGLQELITTLESAKAEPEQSLSIARAYTEHIQVYLTEDTAIQQRQKISIVAKENLVLRVYFFSDPEQYEEMIDSVRELMDTIEFVD